MLEENRVVHGLWIGKELSRMELLTVKSFLKCGHEFHLWLYGSSPPDLPRGTVVRNASEILDPSLIFCYEQECLFMGEPVGLNFGKGSYAGFSDVFRYKVLYEEGGWWSDMDVTCLRSLDFPETYVFRSHPKLGAVGNIMKCPRRSRVMGRCFTRARREVDAHTIEWTDPIRILAESIDELGLSKFIRGGISNEDLWDEVAPFLWEDLPVPPSYHLIHWCNELMRFRGQSADHCERCSTLGRLLEAFHLI